MNFKEELQKRVDETEEILWQYMPDQGSYQKTVLDAMNYSVHAGGKRLRPMMMKEVYTLFGGQGKIVEPFMAALEMIHNYSLIHDDLPCMDNDEYRRGRKTTWVVYGEDMAVLAGDGLLNYAFETAVKAFEMLPSPLDVEPETGLTLAARYDAIGKALSVLAGKAGIYGMIGGQSADVEAEDFPAEKITEDLLLYIHENKTAALIQSAMMIGALLAGADEADVKKMERIAYNVGIAFQIQDDILDVTSSLEVLGKPVGSDEKNNKVTYVTLNGLEKSREDVARLSKEALEELKSFKRRNEFLEKLVEDLITREK